MEEKHMTGGIEFLVVIAFIILVLLLLVSCIKIVPQAHALVIEIGRAHV